MKKLITEIKELIGQNELNAAIKKLNHLVSLSSDTEIEITFLTIKSNYTSLYSAELNGTLSSEESLRERNKIISRLIRFLNFMSSEINFKKTNQLKNETKTILNPIERAEEISIYLKDLMQSNNSDIIRQKAYFSSFSIPNRYAAELVWKDRNGEYPRSLEFYKFQQQERYWLEEHLKKSYCKLIIKPSHYLIDRGTKATILRLKSMRSLLKNYWDKIDIISVDKIGEGKVLCLGNWFYVSSNHASNLGYKKSDFIWDKDMVENQVSKFDAEFDRLLIEKDMDIYDARVETYELIDKKISDLKKE